MRGDDERGQVADCRLRAATDLLAHTWDPVVLAALQEGARRRHDLREGIGGISDKALTEALHRLLGHGLVERRRYAEAPPWVEYRLTGLGASLVDGPLRALGQWALDHGDALLAAQEEPAEARGAATGWSSPGSSADHRPPDAPGITGSPGASITWRRR